MSNKSAKDYINYLKALAASRVKVGRPPNLICYATARCNSNCRTCYYHDKINRSSDSELTLGEWKKIAALAGDIVNLTISGGEPFLREDIALIALAFAERQHLNVISIPTNAILSEQILKSVQTMLESLPESVRLEISVSLDGIGEQHDYIRGVKGSFDKLHETVQMLQTLKKDPERFVLKTCTTLCRSNQDNVEEIIDYSRNKLKVDRAYVSFPHGTALEGSELEVDPAVFERISNYLFKTEISRQVNFVNRSMAAFQYRTNLAQLKILKEKQRFACRVLDSIAIIGEEGSIYSCETLLYVINNIRDYNYNLTDALQSKEADYFRKNIRNECTCTWYAGVLSDLMTKPDEFVKAALSGLIDK